MDKKAKDIFKMTNEEASIIIGNIPVYPDDCYSIAEYQWAKSMAIKALGQQPFINKPCVSEGVCREDKIQVLDKIKAEIEDLTYYSWEVSPRTVIDDVLAIIEKYKAESEDEE